MSYKLLGKVKVIFFPTHIGICTEQYLPNGTRYSISFSDALDNPEPEAVLNQTLNEKVLKIIRRSEE